MSNGGEQDTNVRLDKWLWAARFFKTRSLAQEAIDGGKVFLDGARTKPSRTVHPGQTLQITSPRGQMTITILRVSDKRRSGTEAATLYEETRESMSRREELSLLHKLSAPPAPREKPNTQNRRTLRRIKEG